MNRNRLKRSAIAGSAVNVSRDFAACPAIVSSIVTLTTLESTVNTNNINDNSSIFTSDGTLSPQKVAKPAEDITCSSDVLIDSAPVRTSSIFSHSVICSVVRDTIAHIQQTHIPGLHISNKHLQLESNDINSSDNSVFSAAQHKAPSVNADIMQSSATSRNGLDENIELGYLNRTGNTESSLQEIQPMLCSHSFTSNNLHSGIDECEIEHEENDKCYAPSDNKIVTGSSSYTSVLNDAQGSKYTSDVCQICSKDLRRLNSQRRLQHINRCIDEVEVNEKNKQKQELAFEKLKTKVLECPICGQPLKSLAFRKTHLKKCSLTYSVPITTVMELVKKQEEEYLLQLDQQAVNGVLPVERVASVVKPVRRRKNISRPEIPQTKYDEDCQLALALSTSEEERRTSQGMNSDVCASKSENCVTTGYHTDQNPDAYSRLMTSNIKPVENTLKRKIVKREKTLKQQPLLMTDQAAVQRKLLDKVSLVILQKPDGYLSDTLYQRQQHVKFTLSHLAQKYSAANIDGHQSILWNKSSTAPTTDSSAYYVSELTPPIMPTSAAKSQRIVVQPKLCIARTGRDVRMSSTDATTLNTSSSVLYASTQTAVLLAELASMDQTMDEEEDVNGAHQSVPQQCPAAVYQTVVSSPLERVNSAESLLLERTHDSGTELCGFSRTFTSTSSDSTAVHSLLESLETMVDNERFSDVKILLKDGVLFAHKFILAARSNKLLLLLESQEDVVVVDLRSFSKMAVLAVIRYLYCATLDVPQSVAAEALLLAKRLCEILFC